MPLDPPDFGWAQVPRWLREPTVIFFIVAVVALLGQKLFFDDSRTIRITAAHRADLVRRYHDQLNRPPTTAEAEAFIAAWRSDEALYREALEERIDKEDAAVRSLLVARMKERLLLRTRVPEPTEADLAQYLAKHRMELEAPAMYEHDYVVLPKSRYGIEARDDYLKKLLASATPEALGLPKTAANVDRARIERDFGPDVATGIAGLAPGRWASLESKDAWLLVKLARVTGGLPPPDELQATLREGWKAEQRARALARAARDVVSRYRFEEPHP